MASLKNDFRYNNNNNNNNRALGLCQYTNFGFKYWGPLTI